MLSATYSWHRTAGTPGPRVPQAQVLYNFRREEDVDREALKRLVASINRFLGPEEMPKNTEASSNRALKFTASRPLGGT